MWRFDRARNSAGLVLMVIFLQPFVAYGADPYPCEGQSSVQADLNQCSAEQLRMVDEELNRVYQAIISAYKQDREFLDKLRKAQRAWLKFRDAEMEARFPAEQKQAYYGSVYPMCAAQFLVLRTQERIKQLREWLEGTEEGDMCAGSVQIRPEY